MLPIHLAVGLALGWVWIRGQIGATILLACAALAVVAWGVVVLVSVRDISGFLGGAGIATVNVVLGAIVGALAAYGAGHRARNRGKRV